MNIKRVVAFTANEHSALEPYIVQWTGLEAQRLRLVHEWRRTKEFEIVSADNIKVAYGDESWEWEYFSIKGMRHYLVFKGKEYHVT